MSFVIDGKGLAAPKGHRDGTHRTRSPAETLAAYAPLMPRLGVTRLADITGLDVIGLPVFQAVRPNARSVSVSQGKGVDRDAAAASALMEAIEAWHGERVEGALRFERPAALRRAGEAVVDLHALPRRAGAAVRDDVPTLLVRGWDLIQARPVWVPHACVSVDFVRDPAELPPALIESTNGLASGNHLLEAIAHALCELVERDATALAGPAEAAALDLDAVDDPACRAVIERVRAAGVLVGASDITSDIGVPCYSVRLVDRPGGPRWSLKGLCVGHGCHLDPAVALLRALTEAVQARLTLIAGARDDLSPQVYTAFGDPKSVELAAAALESSPPTRRLEERASLATDSFEGDVAALLARLRAVGLQSAALVDLTRAELGVPVCRAVVPGLEGRFEGAAPGPRARARRAAA